MKTPFMLLGLLVAGQAVAALPADIKAGEVVQVEIAQLHPTQATVGYREMDYKLHRYQGEPKKLFDDYCESTGQKGIKQFDKQSRIAEPASFTCKDAVGAHPGKMKTAVIGPDNQLYLTDGHHTFSIFAEVGGLKTPVQVRVTDDFRSLKTMSAFWQKMEAQHLTWLDTPKGKITPDALPKVLDRQSLQNDEYRSLVYFARDVGLRKTDNPPPFLEFYWGNWLEKQLPLAGFDLSNRDGYVAAVQKIAETVTEIPKDTVIAQSDSGALTAAELGALKRVNKKKLHKLVSATGKLSWAFAE